VQRTENTWSESEGRERLARETENTRSESGSRERLAQETENTRSRSGSRERPVRIKKPRTPGAGDREHPVRIKKPRTSDAGGRERPAQEAENTQSGLPRTLGGQKFRNRLESRPDCFSVETTLYLYSKFRRTFPLVDNSEQGRTANGIK